MEIKRVGKALEKRDFAIAKRAYSYKDATKAGKFFRAIWHQFQINEITKNGYHKLELKGDVALDADMIRRSKYVDTPDYNRNIETQVGLLKEVGQLKDEIGSLKTQLEANESLIKDQKGQINRLLKAFSIISHDVGNAFNALLGFTEMLKDQFEYFDQANREMFLDHMRESAQTAFSLLINLVRWGRSQLDEEKANPVNIHVWELLSYGREQLELAAKLKNVRIGLLELDKNLMVSADRDMADIAIRNILSNAVKYAGSYVKARASIDGKFVKITIVDDGPGLLENGNNLDALQSNDPTFGNKVGMKMTKHYIELNGGRIEAGNRDQSEGTGAVFTICLPLAR